MALRAPSLHEFVSCHRVLVFNPEIRPYAFPPEGVVHVNEYERLVRLGIGEPEHSAPHSGCHFRLYSVVCELDTVIIRRTLLPVMAVSRAVAPVRILVGSGFRVDFPGAGHEQEISQVWNSGPAQMRQRESEQCAVSVLVTGGRVVEVPVGVRAYLDSSERNLCSRIYIAVAVSAYQGSHIVCPAQAVFCGCADGNCGGSGNYQHRSLEKVHHNSVSLLNEYGIVSRVNRLLLSGVAFILNSMTAPSFRSSKVK